MFQHGAQSKYFSILQAVVKDVSIEIITKPSGGQIVKSLEVSVFIVLSCLIISSNGNRPSRPNDTQTLIFFNFITLQFAFSHLKENLTGISEWCVSFFCRVYVSLNMLKRKTNYPGIFSAYGYAKQSWAIPYRLVCKSFVWHVTRKEY